MYACKNYSYIAICFVKMRLETPVLYLAHALTQFLFAWICPCPDLAMYNNFETIFSIFPPHCELGIFRVSPLHFQDHKLL